MLTKRTKSVFLHISAILCTLARSSNQYEVDIVCKEIGPWELKIIDDFAPTCVVDSTLSVTHPFTQVRNVKDENGKNITTDAIEALLITDAVNMKFLPSGIKKSFPKLRALRITDSGLAHLDQHDMEQFGSDLVWIRSMNTQLTALDGDLLKFNENLVYVDFDTNPLKFIDQKLFESFKMMKSLSIINFKNCDCLNSIYNKKDGHEIQTFDWSAVKCSDDSAKLSHVKRISDKSEMNCEVHDYFIISLFAVAIILFMCGFCQLIIQKLQSGDYDTKEKNAKEMMESVDISTTDDFAILIT